VPTQDPLREHVELKNFVAFSQQEDKTKDINEGSLYFLGLY